MNPTKNRRWTQLKQCQHNVQWPLIPTHKTKVLHRIITVKPTNIYVQLNTVSNYGSKLKGWHWFLLHEILCNGFVHVKFVKHENSIYIITHIDWLKGIVVGVEKKWHAIHQHIVYHLYGHVSYLYTISAFILLTCSATT